MKFLKFKNYAVIIGLIAVLISSIVYYTYYSYKRDFYQSLKSVQIQNTENYSAFIQNELRTLKLSVENIGKLLTYMDIGNLNKQDESTIEKISSTFDKFSGELPIITDIYFVREKDGVEISRSGYKELSELKTDLRKRGWYISASGSDSSHLTPVYSDINTYKPVITISYAIRNNNELIGVLGDDLFLEDIHNTYNPVLNSNNNINIFITDPIGNILLHPNQRLLGLFMSNPQQRYIQALNMEKDIIEGYMQVWNEKIYGHESGEIIYLNVNKDKIHGYFNKIPGIDWVIVSKINETRIDAYARKVLVEMIIIVNLTVIGLGMLIYLIYSDIINRDHITGLNKKSKFANKLNKRLGRNKKNIVVFIDIDKFALINSNYGFKVGDKVLYEFSKHLNRILQKKGLLFRLEGDDFIFLFDTQNWDAASYIIKNLCKSLKNLVVQIDNLSIHISVFYVMLQFHGSEIKNSYDFLYRFYNIFGQLKKNCDDDLVFFPDYKQIDELAAEQNNKKEELMAAINEDRIVPFYQPIYNIKENTVMKYELLMRIKSGEEYLLPQLYIRIAEENNIIEKLDLMLIEKALKYKKKADPEDMIQLSVNISGKKLKNPDFLEKVAGLADREQISCGNIIFEITETQNIEDINRLAEIISGFKEKGFGFAIDDFGSGFSSMYYLKCIPVDFIKIDGMFIKDINENSANYYLAKSIVNMAKAFNMKTIGEYVENEKIYNMVSEIGIDYAQGYYVGKPDRFFSGSSVLGKEEECCK